MQIQVYVLIDWENHKEGKLEIHFGGHKGQWNMVSAACGGECFRIRALFLKVRRFPLSRNFNARAHVNFKIETMYGRSRVNAKGEIITSGDLDNIKDKIAKQDNLI